MKEITRAEIEEKVKKAIRLRHSLMLGKMLYADDEHIRDIALETVVNELFNMVEFLNAIELKIKK